MLVVQLVPKESIELGEAADKVAEACLKIMEKDKDFDFGLYAGTIKGCMDALHQRRVLLMCINCNTNTTYVARGTNGDAFIEEASPQIKAQVAVWLEMCR